MNNSSKNVTLKFFCSKVESGLFSKCDGKEYTFLDWIMYITNKDLKLSQRAVYNSSNKIRLESFEYNGPEKDPLAMGYWFLRFSKLRSTDLPSMATDESESKPIKMSMEEYLSEHMHIYYNPKMDVLVIQKKRESLSLKMLSEYINFIWSETGLNLELKPIIEKDILKQFKEADYCKSIEFEVANLKEMDTNNDVVLNKCDEINEISGSVKIGVTLSVEPYKKDETLNKSRLTKLIDIFSKNKKSITKNRVCIKKDYNSRVKYLDLLSGKMEEIIKIPLEERVGMDEKLLENKMHEAYKLRAGEISELLHKI